MVVPKARPPATIVKWEACDESAYESAVIGKSVEKGVAEVV